MSVSWNTIDQHSILFPILCLIKSRQLLTIRGTNKHWCKAVQQSRVWKHRYVQVDVKDDPADNHGEVLESLSKVVNHIQSLELRFSVYCYLPLCTTAIEKLRPLRLKCSTQIHSLYGHPVIVVPSTVISLQFNNITCHNQVDLSKCVNLQNLMILYSNLSAPVEQILQCSQLRAFTDNQSKYTTESLIWLLTEIPTLQHLRISCELFSYVSSTHKLFKSPKQISTVTHFILNVNQILDIEVLEEILRMCSHLTHLQLRLPFQSDIIISQYLKYMPKLQYVDILHYAYHNNLPEIEANYHREETQNIFKQHKILREVWVNFTLLYQNASNPIVYPPDYDDDSVNDKINEISLFYTNPINPLYTTILSQ